MNLHEIKPTEAVITFPWFVHPDRPCSPQCRQPKRITEPADYMNDFEPADHHGCIGRNGYGDGVYFCECGYCRANTRYYHYIDENDVNEDYICIDCQDDEHPEPPE